VRSLGQHLIFKNTVDYEEELRSMIGYPSELVKRKVIRYIDSHCIDFISKSPFVVLSTTDAEGFCDVSPRGDAPGFVYILDDKHLIIPERPGNKRMDSMRNILSNPRVGLLFIIPGMEETLRVNGKATLIRDEEILEKMKVKDRRPLIGIGVEVEECFMHCAKAFKRSQLWEPHSWASKESLPQASTILSAHSNISKEDVTGLLEESYTKRLY
jgi:uncharacterized protein